MNAATDGDQSHRKLVRREVGDGEGDRQGSDGGGRIPGTVDRVLADLSDRSPAFEVFGSARSGGLGERLVAWDGDGRRLPGWPRRVENYVSAGAMAADLDGDGLDEVYGNENTREILGYQPDGRRHWSVDEGGNQQQATPAAADLDGDGDLEIVSTSYTQVSAHHHDGTPVAARNALESLSPRRRAPPAARSDRPRGGR